MLGGERGVLMGDAAGERKVVVVGRGERGRGEPGGEDGRAPSDMASQLSCDICIIMNVGDVWD